MHLRKDRIVVLVSALFIGVFPAMAGNVEEKILLLCSCRQKLCEDYSSLDKRIELLAGAPPQDSRALKELYDDLRAVKEKADGLDSRCEALVQALDEDLRGLFYSRTLEIVPRDVQALTVSLSEQEARLTGLLQDIDKSPSSNDKGRAQLVERLKSIDQSGAQLWTRLRICALTVDYAGRPVSSSFSNGESFYKVNALGQLAKKINPLEERIAALARSLREARAKLGVVDPLDQNSHRQPLQQAAKRINGVSHDIFGVAHGTEIGATPLPIGRRAIGAVGPGPAAALSRLPLAPPSPGHVAVPVIDGCGRYDSEPALTGEIKILKERHLTKTIGDPVGRGKYVFKQTGGTCGIAAQVIVLMEAGLVKTGPENAKRAEDQLYERAVKDGFFGGDASDPKQRKTGGTPPQHIGDLLPMPVVKHYAADPQQLFAAVKRGKTVIVTSDAGRLWNDKNFFNGGHIILVTGAEVESATGKLLGYYVNDTATSPPQAARFITAKQFREAWFASGGFFAEPL